MTIHIAGIKVEQLGPLSRFEMELDAVNLVYGRNETGKTYLVEFIINSLFKTRRIWELRDVKVNGRIQVSGLGNGLGSFSPTTRRKLDDYWKEAGQIMPANMSRLLVIRAGESSLARDNPAGIDHAILKEFLSNSAVIDAVQKAIPKNVQDAEIVNDDIAGTNSGLIKKRKEVAAELERIDDLFEELNSGYSGGELAALGRKFQVKVEAFNAFQKARRGYAHKLHRELAEIDRRIAGLPEADLDALAEEVREYRRKETDARKIQEKRRESQQDSADYEWLEKAVPEYEARLASEQLQPSRILPAASLLAIFLAMVFLILGDNLLAALSMLATLLLGWFYQRQFNRALHNAAGIRELQGLAAEYEKRFGEKLGDLATLKARWEAQKKAAERAAELEKELLELERESSRVGNSIASRFLHLKQGSIDKDLWEETLQGLKRELNELGEDHRQAELELARLGIAEDEYLAEEPVGDFDEGAYRKLHQECRDMQEQIDELEAGLSSLKYSIASFVGHDISTSWEGLIDALQERRVQAVASYRELTAKILAGILLNQELLQLAEAEDERIRAGLCSPLVLAPLHAVTRRYRNIDLQDGQLVVSDDYGDFNLSTLSTGAQEQVLLALRIGFAAKQLGHESLFLVLDDAFQHADWNRRGYLIEQVLDLAERGWQILYLTMDDHIRDLFTARFQPHFGDRFVYRELGEAVVEPLVLNR